MHKLINIYMYLVMSAKKWLHNVTFDGNFLPYAIKKKSKTLCNWLKTFVIYLRMFPCGKM